MLLGRLWVLVGLAVLMVAASVPDIQSSTLMPQQTPIANPATQDLYRRLTLRRSRTEARPLPVTTSLYTVVRVMHAITYQNPATVYNGGIFSPTSAFSLGIVFPPGNRQKEFHAKIAIWALYWSVCDMTLPTGSGLVDGGYEIQCDGNLVGRILYRGRRLEAFPEDEIDRLDMVQGGAINRLTPNSFTLPDNAVGIKVISKGSVVSQAGSFKVLMRAILYLSELPLLQRMRPFRVAHDESHVRLVIVDNGRSKFPFVQNAVALDAILILAGSGYISDGLFTELAFEITVYGRSVGRGWLESDTGGGSS